TWLPNSLSREDKGSEALRRHAPRRTTAALAAFIAVDKPHHGRPDRNRHRALRCSYIIVALHQPAAHGRHGHTVSKIRRCSRAVGQGGSDRPFRSAVSVPVLVARPCGCLATVVRTGFPQTLPLSRNRDTRCLRSRATIEWPRSRRGAGGPADQGPSHRAPRSSPAPH